MRSDGLSRVILGGVLFRAFDDAASAPCSAGPSTVEDERLCLDAKLRVEFPPSLWLGKNCPLHRLLDPTCLGFKTIISLRVHHLQGTSLCASAALHYTFRFCPLGSSKAEHHPGKCLAIHRAYSNSIRPRTAHCSNADTMATLTSCQTSRQPGLCDLSCPNASGRAIMS